MALDSTDLAYLTSRAGVARAGAVRSGFAPLETDDGPLAAPGTPGEYYYWREEAEVTTAWTAVPVA